MNRPSFLALTMAACLAAVPAFGALSANSVFEVRTTGADTNGGGFVTGASGTDRSQQDAAQYSVTDGVTAGSTTITSATANFQTDVVGNIMYVQGGTGAVTAGWYEITARASATSITVDRSTGLTAGTGVTLKIGGALASPALATGIATGSSRHVWVKAGAYTMNTTTNSVAGGRVIWGGTASLTAVLEGYQTTRGDTTTTKPVITATGITTGYMCTSGNNSTVRNIEFNCASLATLGGISLGIADRAEDCIVRNSAVIGYTSNISTFVTCRAVSCATGFQITSGNSLSYGCVAESCTTAGFAGSGSNGMFVYCIDNGSAIGFSVTPQGGGCYNCTANGGSSHGFDIGDGGLGTLINCIAYGRGGVGFRNGASGTNRNNQLINCAGGSNSSNNNWAIDTTMNRGFITLSATPFTNAAGGDFSLNSTAGGGALLKATGYPATFPLSTTPQTLDIGAAQTVNSSPAAVVGTNSVFIQ